MRSIKSWPWIKILLAIGVFLRVYPYLYNRSLWYDEAMLVYSILDQPYSALMSALPYNQAAPIGYMVTQKLLVTLFGDSEYSLRLITLLAGIAIVFLFYSLVKSFFKKRYQVWALTLFVFCQPAIYYSSEVKPYGIDLFFTLLLSVLFIQVNKKKSGWVNLLIAGAVSIYFSFPAIFILAGGGICLFVKWIKNKDWKNLKKIISIGIFWVILFAINFYFFIKPGLQNDTLTSMHITHSFPLAFWKIESLRWYLDFYFSQFRNPGGIFIHILAGIIAILGLYSALKSTSFKWLLLLTPFTLTLLVSSAGSYSTIPRLMLFSIPLLLCLVIEGLRNLAIFVRRFFSFRYRRLIIPIVFLILLLQPFLNAIHLTIEPKVVEEISPVIEHITSNWKAGDQLYIYSEANPAFQYYQRFYEWPRVTFTVGGLEKSAWPKDIDNFKGRTWVLFSHILEREGMKDDNYFLNLIEMETQDSFIEKGASGYLFIRKN